MMYHTSGHRDVCATSRVAKIVQTWSQRAFMDGSGLLVARRCKSSHADTILKHELIRNFTFLLQWRTKPHSSWMGIQPMEPNWPQENPTTRQCWIWHQSNNRIMFVRAQQCLQRWYCMAWCCLLPRETGYLRRFRWTPQLRCCHKSRNSSLNYALNC